MNAPTQLKNLLPTSGLQQGQEIAHESARLHVTGGATYTDDMPELAGTLYAALVLSPVAHGELIGEGIDREALLKTAYRGYEVFECPPNGQGIIVLLILNILSGFDLAAGVDLLIHDAQYGDAEYRERVGWGHSSIPQAIGFAAAAGVKRPVASWLVAPVQKR